MADEPEQNKDEQLDFEINFYEGIISRDPDLVDVLIPLGDAYTKRGHYEKGLEVDKRLSHLKPDDPVVHYNLACSFSLLGMLDDAFAMLKKALVLGYSDLEFMRQDPDLRHMMEHPGYRKLVEGFKPGR